MARMAQNKYARGIQKQVINSNPEFVEKLALLVDFAKTYNSNKYWSYGRLKPQLFLYTEEHGSLDTILTPCT